MSADPLLLRRRRLRIVMDGMLLAWTGVAVHLVCMYVAESRRMQTHVHRQQTTVETIRARPGDVLDRNGRLLATSVDTESLYAVPRAIDDLEEFAAKVAPVLNRDAAELTQELEEYSDKGFYWLARRLEPKAAAAIRELDLPRETYGFEREYRRYYPNGALASHILGFRNIDGVGRGGIEQKFDHLLRGRDGQRTLVRDARNRVIHLYEQSDGPVEHGVTVRLTLDLSLQRLVEDQLDRVMQEWEPTGCCAILCDPRAGDILAIGSRPTYNPTDPETFAEDAWMNRAVAWSYEPGSTMKPLIVAWALQQNAISTESRFHGHWGEYRMGSRLLHDSHSFGEMSLAEVLIHSSNIGMAQIGERLTNDGLFTALQQFGFGSQTGLGLPGELKGFVRPLASWDLYSTGSIPMGQELSVTPLQMLVAHATLANRGEFRQPRIVLRAGDHRSTEVAPQVAMPLIDPILSDWLIRNPMRRVLTEGTGQRVNVEGLDLFGKTGTSQVYDPELRAYSNEKTVCSFVCGIPSHNPELVLIVAVDQPTVGSSHYGSNVAAPAAVRILQQAWRTQHATRPIPAVGSLR